MSRFILALFLVTSISCVANAGENTRATLGDVKEAVYKLIIQNKAIKSDSMQLDSEVAEIKNKIALNKEKDKYDLFIENFVDENKQILQ